MGGETNTTKGQTNPLKEENPLKSVAKLSNSPIISAAERLLNLLSLESSSGILPFHLCAQHTSDEHDSDVDKRCHPSCCQ